VLSSSVSDSMSIVIDGDSDEVRGPNEGDNEDDNEDDNEGDNEDDNEGDNEDDNEGDNEDTDSASSSSSNIRTLSQYSECVRIGLGLERKSGTDDSGESEAVPARPSEDGDS
jgi:hypothetical protein